MSEAEPHMQVTNTRVLVYIRTKTNGGVKIRLFSTRSTLLDPDKDPRILVSNCLSFF